MLGIPRNFMLLKQNVTREETKPQLHQLCGLLSFTQIIDPFCHLSVPSGQNTMLSSLRSILAKHKQGMWEEQVPHSPSLEWTRYSGKQLACPPDSPHCTQHVHFQTSTPTFPNRKPQSMLSHTSALSLQRLMSCTAPHRTSSSAFPWCDAHTTGNTSCMFCSLPNYFVISFSSRIINLVQLFESQLQKALTNLIQHEQETFKQETLEYRH